MFERKHLRGKRFAFLLVIVCIVCAAVGIWKGLEAYNQDKQQEEKQQELVQYSGMYNPESIVLSDTTPEQAERLAELLQARLRITSDGSFAVLYLPEGVQVEDVYNSDAYKIYLSAMSLDYYVSAEAVSAAGQELVSARPSFIVEDELYPQQNYLDYINLQDTWTYTKGEGITVAVIDSGIDTDHPDFVGRISDRSYDATDDLVVSDYGLEVIEDEDGHGTSVAGIIAAGMNDSVGITGIAPEVELIVIKCDTDGNGNFLRTSDLVFGLAYAIECDADVINMSFGTSVNSFSKYTRLAADSDIICVAAAGNDGSPLPMYPAADDYVIAVGAMDTQNWSLAYYSNYGYNLVLAPGTAYTTALNGGYSVATGTSISSPVVASAVALYLSVNPYTEFNEMCELLKASSVDLGILGEDRQHGFGALDIYALVCEEKGTITYEMLSDELKSQTQIFVKGHTIQYMPEPERENVVLDGWYHDIQCTDEVMYYETVFTSDVTLYASWINEDDGTAYIYRELEDGTVEIQSYTGRRRYLTIPSVLEGKTVTSIGEYAFAENSRLRSVVLPDTLKNISNGAFYGCDKIRSIEIPENVVFIGNEAFYGCVSLSQVSLFRNSALASIGDKAFGMCAITAFHLPAKLSTLGSGVFYGSIGINSVTVDAENTCYQVSNSALYNADGTTLVYYPTGLSGSYSLNENTQAVADYAFAYCRSRNIVLNEGLLQLGIGAFENSYVTKVLLPASVTNIGIDCYSGSNVSELTFEEGIALAEISVRCFSNCRYLRSVTVPAGIQVINEEAFLCSSLASIHFAPNSSLSTIGSGAFLGCPVTEITFPASLKTIDPYAFQGCTSLHTMHWASESKLSGIAQYAFMDCAALTQLTLPDSLTFVGYCAFYGSGLEELNIGAGLTDIGEGAFSGCRNLQQIHVSSTNPVYASQDGIVFSKDQTVLYWYPAGRGGVFALPGTVVRIADMAFAEAARLTEVILNEGLTEIGGSAFSQCSELALPILPASLTTIGENAFEYCISMNGTLHIPKNVISIGRFAFYQDYGLTGIVIEPESQLSRIGYGTFGYCGITDFTVPRSVSSMGQEVFLGCKNLIAVTFEADSQLEAIAAWTFSGAEKLRQITFEEGSVLKLLEARSLEGLRNLERITLEYCTQLTTIDNYAFQNCASLAEVTLPDSLAEIGRYAFNGCVSLSRLDLPENVTSIGRYAFNRTNNLNVYFRASVLPVQLEENWDYGISGYYVSTAEVITSGYWQYALTGDGKASIVSYYGNESHIDLTTMDGYDVISVGSYAFAGNTTLQSIVLPDTLQGVYQYAFQGTTALESITIPASVAVIDTGAFEGSGLSSITFAEDSGLVSLGRSAFADTANLGSIAIPDGVETIHDYTFQRSGLQEITFGENSALTEIGRYAFHSSGLESIVLPAGVTKIDYDAFYDCAALKQVDMRKTGTLQIFANAFYGSGLTEVFLPAGVEYIGEFCFTACPDLTQITVDANNANYASVDGVLYNKSMTRLITCPAGITGSYTVPGTVATLGFAAFEGSRLSEVVFPEDSALVTLGYRVFYDCDNLTEIAIPAGVQSIDNYAFAECDHLARVTFPEGSQLGGIYKSAFYNNVALASVSVPEGVQEIGDYAFYGCTNLTELEIPENSQLKGIYDYAFAYTGVTEFVMPAGLLDVGNSAFQGAKLETLVCNEAVMEIGDYAFADCGLAKTTVLEFPATVEYMGRGVLQGAANITELSLPLIKDCALSDIFNLTGQGVSLQKVSVVGKNPIPFNAFTYCDIQTIILSDEITAIDQAAFFSCKIGTIQLPDALVSIGLGAFQYADINHIELPDGLQRIDAHAFYSATIQDINLPESIGSIGEAAFTNTNITNVTIPCNVKDIGPGAFSGCKNLDSIHVDENNQYYASQDGILYTKDLSELISVPGGKSGEVVVPDGITSIPNYAFYYCQQISSVTLPETVQSLGSYAFSECHALERINIPASVVKIGEYCFYQDHSLKSVEILNPSIEIGNTTFYACSSLEYAVLPEGLTEIPTYMFLGCRSLKEIHIPDSVTRIGYMAFNCCTSLSKIEIPENVVTIMEAAFSGCSMLSAINVDPNNHCFTSVDGILYNKDCTQIISVPAGITGHVTIPEGVTCIGEYAFEDCANLEGITIPDSVELIESWAFSGCLSLADIHIGNGVKNMQNGALGRSQAFSDDPDNWENDVLYIDGYAVWGTATQLRVFREGTTFIGGMDGSETTHVWMPDTVLHLAEYAFDSHSGTKAIRISKSLKTVNRSVFLHCNNLTSINLPDGVEFVSASAFGGLPQLKYLKGGATENSYENIFYDFGISAPMLQTLYIPYTESMALVLDDTSCRNIIISTTGSMSTQFLSKVAPDTRIFCYVDDSADWPEGWNHGCTTYYKDEWHLATFYADDVIVTMNPIVNGNLVQVPSNAQVAELLWPGTEFLGWDINGDNLVDEIPVTLTEDLEAHAVLKVSVTDISLSETEVTMEAGDEKTLAVTYNPSYFNTSGELVWTSSDETIATVDETGSITALAEGQVTITATLAENSAVTASCSVTVIPPQPGIRLPEESGSLNVGEQLTLEPRYVLLEDVMDTLAFTSSDETVATVDGTGTITAIAPGTAEITVSCGGYTAVYTLTVLLPAEKITITAPGESMNVGEAMILTVQFFPENTTDDRTVAWSSSDGSVASISSSGEITAIAPGTVTITAQTKTGLTAECEITVYAPLQWIQLNTTVGTLRLDRTKQLEVIYEPGNTTDDKTVVWSSSNPEIASVSETGLVTGLKRGTAVITAQVGEHTAAYTVTVIGLRDETTGITVTNSDDTAMDEDVELEVEHHDHDHMHSEYFSIWELICHMMFEQFGDYSAWYVYDITMTEHGEHIQPDTQVDVEVPFLDGMDRSCFKIYRVEEDGTLTDMTAESIGQYAFFRTDHFSLYVIGSAVQECEMHTFGEWFESTAAGCVDPGEESRNCTVCGFLETREIPAAGHHYDDVVTNPTCTEQGYTTHTCHCGDSYVDDYVDALGHEFGEWYTITAPTCVDDGLEQRDCIRCDHYEIKVIAATGHTYTSVVTAPTCTAQGYTTHTCACGDSYVDSFTPATGHSFGDWYVVKEATCTTDGQQRRDCANCDHYETKVIAATGHNYEDGTCTHCGQAELEYLLGDVNGDGEVDIFDANLIVGYYNGTVELSEEQILIADVNGDGEVDIFDANLIVSYYNGTILSFPAEKLN